MCNRLQGGDDVRQREVEVSEFEGGFVSKNSASCVVTDMTHTESPVTGGQ